MINFKLSLKERAFKEMKAFRTREGRKALRALGNLKLAWNLQRVKGSRQRTLEKEDESRLSEMGTAGLKKYILSQEIISVILYIRYPAMHALK